MKSNRRLLQINRTFIICFVSSAITTVVAVQVLSDYENYLKTTLVVALGYVAFFGVFVSLFYLDNRERYKSMPSGLIKKELVATISSLGVGELVYLAVKWTSLYYFLELGIEPYLASLASETVAAACYIVTVTALLRKTKTI